MTEPVVVAGRYRLTAPLGHGDDSWVADDLVRRRRVVVVPVEPAEAPIRRALQSLAELGPSVFAPVLDYVVDAGRAFLVREWISGESLAQRVGRGDVFTVDEVARIGSRVAAGLAALHRIGIAHRAISPATLLLDDDHNVTIVGLVPGSGPERDAGGLTGPRILASAVAYLAPEIFAGLVGDAASDVWALGATLFAALEGHAPHDPDRASIVALMYRALNSPAPDPVHAGRLGPVLQQMLAADPASRPDANQVADLLRAAPVEDPSPPTMAPSAPPLQAAPPAAPPIAAPSAAPPMAAPPAAPSAAPPIAAPSAAPPMAYPSAFPQQAPPAPAGPSYRPSRPVRPSPRPASPAHPSVAVAVAAVSLDQAARDALAVEVRLGTLALSVPGLRVGRRAVVTVGIGRGEDADRVARHVLDPGTPVAAELPLDTTAVMAVDLHGASFDITRLGSTDAEQLVVPAARWDFVVVPRAGGPQTLTVAAWMRIPIPGHGERSMMAPSLSHTVQVDVDRMYAARSFARQHWQFIVTTVVAVATLVVTILALH